jgi:ABC-type lipoprotein export system ATPase subunit
MDTVLACRNLSCDRALWNDLAPSRVADLTAEFRQGELCGFCGPDGSGKGLLLNILGLLEPPDAGEVVVSGINARALPEDDLRQLRNEAYGFLFNQPCLLPSFSVAENVAMPLFRICGGDARSARTKTLAVLEFCGMNEEETTLAGRLETSARTRTAFARALVHEPEILVAISPPDDDAIVALGRRAAEELGLCVLWAGPEPTLTRHAHRILRLDGGAVTAEVRP